MSELKWTPGPWRAGRSDIGRTAVVEGCVTGDRLPATVCVAFGVAEEALANAHLIAAAPELYEALDLALELLSVPEHSQDEEWHEKHLTLAPVLAKARGEEP